MVSENLLSLLYTHSAYAVRKDKFGRETTKKALDGYLKSSKLGEARAVERVGANPDLSMTKSRSSQSVHTSPVIFRLVLERSLLERRYGRSCNASNSSDIGCPPVGNMRKPVVLAPDRGFW